MSVVAIVSAYYAEPYLQGCLENLWEQSLRPRIVVVAQLGSVELEIASSFARKVGVFELVISQTPDIPTVYEAWNLGLRCSDSDFVMNLNSDDRLYPNAVRILERELAGSPEYAMAYGNADRVREIGGPPYGRVDFLEGGFEELMHGCFLGPFPMWRRSLHGRYGYFDGSFTVAGDYEFWLRIASQGERFKHIRSVLGSHLERDDALEHRAPVRALWETARARAKYRKERTNVRQSAHAT